MYLVEVQSGLSEKRLFHNAVILAVLMSYSRMITGRTLIFNNKKILTQMKLLLKLLMAKPFIFLTHAFLKECQAGVTFYR